MKKILFFITLCLVFLSCEPTDYVGEEIHVAGKTLVKNLLPITDTEIQISFNEKECNIYDVNHHGEYSILYDNYGTYVNIPDYGKLYYLGNNEYKLVKKNRRVYILKDDILNSQSFF